MRNLELNYTWHRVRNVQVRHHAHVESGARVYLNAASALVHGLLRSAHGETRLVRHGRYS